MGNGGGGENGEEEGQRRVQYGCVQFCHYPKGRRFLG